MTRRPKHILIVTGMSGAGKSTALRTLEDLGWETVDNLPLPLLPRLIEPSSLADAGRAEDERPLAIGIGAHTRGFDAKQIIARVDKLRAEGVDIGTLFLECMGNELERRYSETRRRHPLAKDRPASDGIAREREILAPIRAWSNRMVDTTRLAANELARIVRATFSAEGSDEATLNIMSFGFSRGVPRDADLVLDMRYLRNPHWDAVLRPGTGMDADVSAYIKDDVAYAASMEQIEALLLLLLPRYSAEGKSYVTIAFGCTGGRHRSVHVAERMAARLRVEGFSPTVTHRDLQTAPQDSLEGVPLRV